MSFSLINRLEETAGKTKYIIFEVSLGFETFNVEVPDEFALEFESEINRRMPKTRSGVISIAEKYNKKGN